MGWFWFVSFYFISASIEFIGRRNGRMNVAWESRDARDFGISLRRVSFLLLFDLSELLIRSLSGVAVTCFWSCAFDRRWHAFRTVTSLLCIARSLRLWETRALICIMFFFYYDLSSGSISCTLLWWMACVIFLKTFFHLHLQDPDPYFFLHRIQIRTQRNKKVIKSSQVLY